MSHEIINAIDALKERLIEARQETTFNVIVDPTSDEVIDNDSLPHVRMFPTRIGAIEDEALNARGGFGITVMLRLREDPQYGLYNDSKTRGILWLVEKVANCIDGSDLGASQAWGNSPVWEVIDYVANETVLQFDINVKLTTARFTRGNL